MTPRSSPATHSNKRTVFLLPLLGALLIVFAFAQHFNGWLMHWPLEPRPADIKKAQGCNVVFFPKVLRGEPYGRASYVMQNNAKVTGVTTPEGLMAGSTPGLAFTDKAVMWRPLPEADEKTRYTIILTPEFTVSFWFLTAAGVCLMLHPLVGKKLTIHLSRAGDRFAILNPARQNCLITSLAMMGLAGMCLLSGKIRDFGYDGVRYAKMADRGWTVTKDHDDMPLYSLQRIAPMMLVHQVAAVVKATSSAAGKDVSVTDADRAAGLRQFNQATLLLGFFIVGGLFIAAASWSALRTCDHLGFSARRKTVTFVLLFGSFPFLRLFAYYPGLSDYFGFAVGMFSLHAYVTGRRAILVLLAAIGAYTFPMTSLVALGLLAASLERRDQGNIDPGAVSLASFARHRWRVGGLAATLTAVVFWQMAPTAASAINELSTRPLPALLPLNVLFAAAFVGAVAAGVLTATSEIRVVPRRWLRGATIALVLFLTIQYTTVLAFGRLANGEQSFQWLLKVLVASSTIDPLCFLGAHLSYAGLVVVVMAASWSAMWVEAGRRGLSFTLLLALMLVFALMSETRCLSNAMPFFVFAAACVMPESLSSSRCFFAQTIVCWAWLPLQRGTTYFIPFGPWNDHLIAWLKLCILLAIFLLHTRLTLFESPVMQLKPARDR